MVRNFFVYFSASFCLFTFFIISPIYAADIKINEAVVHPSSGGHEWVEFYNPDHINITQYYIDDDTDFINDVGSSKKQLSAIQGSDTDFPYVDLTSSMFNNDGDSVVLFDTNGNVIDQYTYTKDPGENISFGRNPDGSGDFSFLTSATQGQQNASGQATPTLSPTKTLTPTHTPVPSRMPTPSHTPTPKKTETPTPASKTKLTSIPTSSQSFTSNKNTSSLDPTIEDDLSLSASDSSQEAVLAASISAKPTPIAKLKVLVKAATKKTNYLPFIFSSIGGVCLLLCGILIYRKL